MSDQTPWAERTVEMPPEPPGFRRGVAQVGVPRQRTEPDVTTIAEPVGGAWPGVEPGPQLPPGYHWRQLRVGAHWSMIGALFAFVCWGIWAISGRGDLTSPVVTFLLTLCIAAGLFALSRLVGRVVLERQLGRIRRSARAAHLVTGAFLVAVGVTYLRQTAWVVDLWNWVVGLG
jgi:hypothetical protein